MSAFSERLQKRRLMKNWSKSATAEKLGISAQRYSNWEYGSREPDYDMLTQIAELFDTTTDYLTGKTDDPSPHSDNDNALTWEDLGMPYGGVMPKELKETYADLAHSYFKRHPEYLNKNGNKNNEEQ
ncbi:helix-turn-helix domain-containing protein [Lactobacillus helveticus]|uniref:helix-turn-helix domain-containing protein n=2 Tax=Lactobacillus helveticus TaxID=1587 RepID=UPI00062A78B4|nr:helix-turn-helix transcriptional regulator [Lactobacillus helveticus]AKG66975.1 transcriptional regulator [Lactobacillus helveticus]